MGTKEFESLWYWLYGNLFAGKVSMVISTLLLFCAIYVFLRWKMYALSMIMLSLAFVTAYSGGLVMVFRGAL